MGSLRPPSPVEFPMGARGCRGDGPNHGTSRPQNPALSGPRRVAPVTSDAAATRRLTLRRSSMATVAACEQAFATLAERLAKADADVRRRNSFDRSITCRLTDLDVTLAGHL